MLAAVFILSGYDTVRQPERVSPLAEPVVSPLSDRIPGVPGQPEDAVRLNGGIQLVAGTLLALGWWPRLSALALAGTLVPTTLAGHPFWRVEDKEERTRQRIHFLKNAAMLGGLLIAAADTGGRPSLAWRSRHAARSARRSVSRTARTARVAGRSGAAAGRARGRLSAR